VYSISPTQQTIRDNGGNGAPVNVTAPSGCAWTAVSEVPWIHITSGASGSGNGTVRFNVDRNHGDERTGRLIIAGRIFTLVQEEDE
jgi:hypothetical protein